MNSGDEVSVGPVMEHELEAVQLEDLEQFCPEESARASCVEEGSDTLVGTSVSLASQDCEACAGTSQELPPAESTETKTPQKLSGAEENFSPETNQSYVTCQEGSPCLSLDMEGLDLDDTIERMDRLLQLAQRLQAKADSNSPDLPSPATLKEMSTAEVAAKHEFKQPALPPLQLKRPQTTPKKDAAKEQSGSRIPTPRPPSIRSRIRNVVSPVARYIHEKPVPPLISCSIRANKAAVTPKTSRLPVAAVSRGKENQRPLSGSLVATPEIPAPELHFEPVLPERFYEVSEHSLDVAKRKKVRAATPGSAKKEEEDEPLEKYGKAAQLLLPSSPAAIVLHHGRQRVRPDQVLSEEEVDSLNASGVDVSVIETKKLTGCTKTRRHL